MIIRFISYFSEHKRSIRFILTKFITGCRQLQNRPLSRRRVESGLCPQGTAHRDAP